MALTTRYLSGRLDLNQRPPDPQSGALTRLRHAPIFNFLIVEMGTLGGFPNPPAIVEPPAKPAAPHATILPRVVSDPKALA